MAKLWLSVAFKPVDVSRFPNAPNRLPIKYEEWLPKFNGSDAITTEKHKYEFYWVIDGRLIEEEDIVMMLFALSLEGSVNKLYLDLPKGSLKN